MYKLASAKYTSKFYNIDLQETTNESSLVVGGEKGSRFVLFSELYHIKRQCFGNFAAVNSSSFGQFGYMYHEIQRNINPSLLFSSLLPVYWVFQEELVWRMLSNI